MKLRLRDGRPLSHTTLCSCWRVSGELVEFLIRHPSHSRSGGSPMKEPLGGFSHGVNITFPPALLENEGYLNLFVSAPFSGNNEFMPRPLWPDIELSRRVEGGEGGAERREREMETERNGDRGGQLCRAECQRWIWERLHKASLVLLSGAQHAESGIHACFRCRLLASHRALNLESLVRRRGWIIGFRIYRRQLKGFLCPLSSSFFKFSETKVVSEHRGSSHLLRGDISLLFPEPNMSSSNQLVTFS